METSYFFRLSIFFLATFIFCQIKPFYCQAKGKSKQEAAKAQICLFETALKIYRLDVGKYPTTDQGLAALRIKPEGEKRWDGPYLPDDIPLDPWGNPYEYRLSGDSGHFYIISFGADGKEGGIGENKDVLNW